MFCRYFRNWVNRRNPELRSLLGVWLVAMPLHDAYGQPSLNVEPVRVPVSAEQPAMPFRLALDQVGIIPRRDMPQEKVADLGRAFSGSLIRAYPGGVHVFELAAPVTRRALFELAREQRRSSGDILQAGMVLYPEEGPDLPVMVNDELLVRFSDDAASDVVSTFAAETNLVPVMNNPLVKQLWLFRLPSPARLDTLETVSQVRSRRDVVYSHPNFFLVRRQRQTSPQWHHQNMGLGGGTEDADVDSDRAWQLTAGVPGVSIAIIDESFDTTHPDIQANLTAQFNLANCTETSSPTCATSTVTAISNDFLGEDNHGTPVAGLAVGGNNNSAGFSGVCPGCSLILVQMGLGVSVDALALSIAQTAGADIINNSWGYAFSTIPQAMDEVIDAVVQAGTTIFWAMSNDDRPDCAVGDISADDRVVAVSAVSNQDRKVAKAGYGDCMDLVAPSHAGYGPSPPLGTGFPFVGTLNIATTDRTGNAGLNDASPPANHYSMKYDPNYCLTESGDLDYTLCFGGTSASTPIAAGAAGLMLSADNTLTPLQVQYALQDTADKIEPAVASYGADTARSTTHGYGRVNAFEAVRLVAPGNLGNGEGRNGIDIFLRDNRLDWGNTEQPSFVRMDSPRGRIAHYRSADIKVDAPPYQSVPIPTRSADFDAITHENPVSQVVNHVYVRVHNRGPNPASSVQVKLHWAFAGTALPALPSDFWSAWPADSAVTGGPWHSLGLQTPSTVDYSGASVAGTMEDHARVLRYDFTGPDLNPALPAFRHYCLFAVVDSSDDPVADASRASLVPDFITPRDNNVTHLNVAVQDPLAPGGMSGGLFVRNPFERAIKSRLTVVKPKDWHVKLDRFTLDEPFELAAGKEVPVSLHIDRSGGSSRGSLELVQEVWMNDRYQPLGGFVYRFGKPD